MRARKGSNQLRCCGVCNYDPYITHENRLTFKYPESPKEESSEGVVSEEDANREIPASDGSSAYGIGYSDIDFDDVTSFGNVNVIWTLPVNFMITSAGHTTSSAAP